MDEKKNNKVDNNEEKKPMFSKNEKIMGAIIFSIPIIFVFILIFTYYNHVNTPYWEDNDRNPSIYDDDWRRDNYGGTKHYP